MEEISVQAIEEMKKDFEENPKHKKIVENQLIYFFPKWIGEKIKEKSYIILGQIINKFVRGR